MHFLISSFRRVLYVVFSGVWCLIADVSEHEVLGQYVPVYHTKNFYPHSFRIHSPMKMEQTQCSETSAIKHHTPENNPKDYTRQINTDFHENSANIAAGGNRSRRDGRTDVVCTYGVLNFLQHA
jgi:hypothetical protein